MEKSARRRLDCISRHLVLPPQANHGLQQVLLLSNGQVKSEKAEPVVLLLLLSNLHNHKAPFGSRNGFEGKTFPMSFPKE
ncbi:unnamed protein product [Prunus armeniaca]|uniref:Uncharacterized protein n=1 Tax=Prunus armeniaca TaxID=36596 RepID=A0A6J5VQK8_PRUAR|nr:unnamed protein product [Prunus armeniaca]CAB4320555.1 unnamed protein product [Prunus armeniaca]